MYRAMFFATWIAGCLLFVDAPAFGQAKAKNAPPATKKKDGPRANSDAQLKLGRLASEESVFFLASNGWMKPSATSTNKTEKLWAEQSVQDFIQQLSDEVKQAIEKQTAGDQAASLIASTAPVILSAAIQHPMAISLTSFTVEETPEINLAIVIDTESDEASIREAFEKLIASATSENSDELAEIMIDGTKFYRPSPRGGEKQLDPRFGMYKSYLILTLGPEMAVRTLKKIKSNEKSPAWLNELVKDLKIDRPSLAWQLNVQDVWKSVDSLITDSTARTALEATGLFAVKRIAGVSGLDAVSSVDKMQIETEGEPKGALALLPKKALTAKDLKGIPANPSSAAIVRFDLELAVNQVLTILDQVDPTLREQFDQVSEQGEQVVGFSIKDDLLKSFGDVWSFYTSSSEAGGGFIPGVVIASTIRDQTKLLKVQDALVTRAKEFLTQMGPQAPVTLSDFQARGTKGYRVQINNLPIPVTPSWVITKDQFVFGLSPQLVTVHISSQSKPTSFADQPEVKAALTNAKNLVMLSYRDPKPGIQGLYALINTFSPILLGQLQQQGIQFNLPPLPPYSDIEPHLEPSISTFKWLPNGWESESHGVVPSFSTATPAAAAVMVALLLPAVQQAREAARRTQGKNNLKQIGLAFHNYHDVHNHFPSRVFNDSKGNPGLSWRVHLLPYLDEGALYNEFHLDEPWDSEHNKPLIARMPQVYTSPNDPELAAEGKTRLMVLDGDGCLFDKSEDGPGIRDITDGTSNTIMAVEAEADRAVIWTKPDDLEVDMDDPLDGLEESRAGGFHVLLADGSVRFVSSAIDLETLKALFTSAGGEILGNF